MLLSSTDTGKYKTVMTYISVLAGLNNETELVGLLATVGNENV